MEEQSLLKVSLHGMNDRMQKMMASYLKHNCNGLAVVVSEDKAEAELVDVETKKSYSLLVERLSQDPSKPVIALSSKKLPTKRVIHVLKPINVMSLSHALIKVEKILNVNSAPDTGKPALSSQAVGGKFLTLDEQSQAKVGEVENREGNGKSFSSFINKNEAQVKKSSSKVFNSSGKRKFDPKHKNRRGSVRYSFQSIKMILKKTSVLGGSQNIPVLIINNSSKGAYIHLSKPRRLNGKVMLEIQLDDGRSLAIPARIVRKESNTKYGLYFLKFQHELTENLIDSGHQFSF